MNYNQSKDIHLQFLDFSMWQVDYKDDGIDEGVRIDGVIPKAASGTRDFTKPGSWEYDTYWPAQWESIKHFKRKWMYHWFQTELSAVDQANLAVDISDRFTDEIDAWVVDFEAYFNTIDASSIQELATYVSLFRMLSSMKLVIYTNTWIYKKMIVELGQAWADSQEWWFAGGKLYNTKLEEFPDESYFDNLFDYPGRVMVQWSADKNFMADEHDFGNREVSSIDMDHSYWTAKEYDVWLGRSATLATFIEQIKEWLRRRRRGQKSRNASSSKREQK